jgi:ribonuclease HII
MTLILGIDDAGRGPVLGPMVLAGVLADISDNKILKEMGAKDSKLLLPKKRKEIKENIIKKYKYHIELATSEEIDKSTNLNYLEAIHTAKIINELTKNLNEKINVIVDCPSTNIKSWSNDVWQLIKRQEIISLSCEHKADFNHPIVSAASIVAKEKREDEMERLRKWYEVDFGSGYPADPKTKEFILKNFDNPKYILIIRFSWATVKKLIKNKISNQKKLF